MIAFAIELPSVFFELSSFVAGLALGGLKIVFLRGGL
jgi:hypothetical protein